MDCIKSLNSSSSREPYKSWGEEQIGRMLGSYGIKFDYEYPLAIDYRGKMRIYYPDFRLPEESVIIEYFGVNGDSQYDQSTKRKLEVYRNAGIDGLFLNRDSLRGDWPDKILDGIEAILNNRQAKFDSHRRGASSPDDRFSGILK